MGATVYIHIPHAADSACTDTGPRPSSWPKPRSRKPTKVSYAQFEIGARSFFQHCRAGSPLVTLSPEAQELLTIIDTLNDTRGVRTRLPLAPMLSLMSTLRNGLTIYARGFLSWLETHQHCSKELIYDVYCDTSGIYDDTFED